MTKVVNLYILFFLEENGLILKSENKCFKVVVKSMNAGFYIFIYTYGIPQSFRAVQFHSTNKKDLLGTVEY